MKTDGLDFYHTTLTRMDLMMDHRERGSEVKADSNYFTSERRENCNTFCDK